MQVFMSHAAGDRQLAEDLAAELEKAEIKAWNPYRSLFPGDNWAMEAGKALESSNVMVVLLTHNAQESPTIAQDVQYALTSGNYRGRVVPVLVNMATYHSVAEVRGYSNAFHPVKADGHPPDFHAVVERVKKEVAEAECNATA